MTSLTKEQWIEKGQQMIADQQRRIKQAKKWKFDTVATHGVYDFQEAFERNNGSIMEPVYLTPAEAYADSAHMEAALAYEMPTWCYSRIANPSTFYLEQTAALLETYGSDIEASCCATASGMAAIRTATDPFLTNNPDFDKPNIVASAKVYGGTFQQFWERRAKEQGIEVRWVKESLDTAEWKSQIDEQTRFVFGEFPSNPAVALFDIEAVAKLAHDFDTVLIVDSTCASPALTRPLVWGADIVIHSASKVMGSSGTSIMGLLIAKKDIKSKFISDDANANFAIWAKLWPFRDNGPSVNPMAAIMTLNDMRSLRMRLEKMSGTALEVAEFLDAHPKISKVYYPGLKDFSGHEIAKKYMKLADTDKNMYGYMMAVEIKEEAENASVNARIFYDNLSMIWRATDLGRVKTVATLNAISTHHQQGEEGRALADIKPSTCRISIGIEDPSDIIAELSKALDAI